MSCMRDWMSCDWLGFLLFIRRFIWAGYYIKIEISVLEASVRLWADKQKTSDMITKWEEHPRADAEIITFKKFQSNQEMLPRALVFPSMCGFMCKQRVRSSFSTFVVNNVKRCKHMITWSSQRSGHCCVQFTCTGEETTRQPNRQQFSSWRSLLVPPDWFLSNFINIFYSDLRSPPSALQLVQPSTSVTCTHCEPDLTCDGIGSLVVTCQLSSGPLDSRAGWFLTPPLVELVSEGLVPNVLLICSPCTKEQIRPWGCMVPGPWCF